VCRSLNLTYSNVTPPTRGVSILKPQREGREKHFSRLMLSTKKKGGQALFAIAEKTARSGEREGDWKKSGGLKGAKSALERTRECQAQSSGGGEGEKRPRTKRFHDPPCKRSPMPTAQAFLRRLAVEKGKRPFLLLKPTEKSSAAKDPAIVDYSKKKDLPPSIAEGNGDRTPRKKKGSPSNP